LTASNSTDPLARQLTRYNATGVGYPVRMPRAAFLDRAGTAAIVLLALALRVAGLDFGLPMAEARPDELTIAFQAMKFGSGDLNPHSFHYPSLFKYMVFSVFGAWYAVGRAIGEFSSKDEFLLSFFDGAVSFRLLMRAMSAGMSTAAVWMLCGGPGGRWAAFFLAVAFLPVRDAHFGVTDSTMVTFVVASVLAAERLRQDGTPRAATLAGGLAGLATSIKYNAAILVFPLVIAALLAPRRHRHARGPALAAVALAYMGACFLAGTPYAIADFTTFWKDFSYELNHLRVGQFVDVGGGWRQHLTASLPLGMGWPLFALGLLGMGWTAFRAPEPAAVLWSFPVVYFWAIGRGETAFFRYMLPVVPFLCMGAGLLAGPLGLLRLALPFAAFPTLASSIAAIRLFNAGDTRDAMGRWIEANVPKDAAILHAGAYSGAPMLQRNVENQTREYTAKRGRADSAGFRKPDDPRWYRHDRPMYDVVFLEKQGIEFASQRSLEDVLADPPRWLETEAYFLDHYSSVPPELRRLAEARYELVHREDAFVSVNAPVFDQQDALYLPAAGFEGFTRMGPTLSLYRRRD
jgi:hypothetical protein